MHAECVEFKLPLFDMCWEWTHYNVCKSDHTTCPPKAFWSGMLGFRVWPIELLNRLQFLPAEGRTGSHRKKIEQPDSARCISLNTFCRLYRLFYPQSDPPSRQTDRRRTARARRRPARVAVISHRVTRVATTIRRFPDSLPISAREIHPPDKIHPMVHRIDPPNRYFLAPKFDQLSH